MPKASRATPCVISTPASVWPNDASSEGRSRRTRTTCPSPLTRATSARRIRLPSLRVLIDHRRVCLWVGFGSLRRRWDLHLARALLYLPADGLQRRRDAFGKGVAALGRPFLHLRLHRALAEGEMHHHLAAALAAVRDREPPRVVASGLRTPLHPAFCLVHGEVALGVEGVPLLLPRVLECRPDPLAGDTLSRGPLLRGSHYGGQVLRQVTHVREPS